MVNPLNSSKLSILPYDNNKNKNLKKINKNFKKIIIIKDKHCEDTEPTEDNLIKLKLITAAFPNGMVKTKKKKIPLENFF